MRSIAQGAGPTRVSAAVGTGLEQAAEPVGAGDGEVGGGLFGEAAEDDVGDAVGGWIWWGDAAAEFFGDEGVVVVGDGVFDGVVIGGAGLDEDLAPFGAAASAAGNLAQELEAAFAGAEVGEVDDDVGVDHADEGDVGEIQPLGDHLGSHQDIDLAAADAVEDVGVGPFAGGGVDVHAGDAGTGEAFAQEAFDLLGAESALAEGGATALPAGGLGEFLVHAIVADQALGGFVVGEGDAAVGAGGGGAARFALHEGGVAAAIEEEDALFAALETEVEGGV